MGRSWQSYLPGFEEEKERVGNDQGGREIIKICITMKAADDLNCCSPNLTMLELEAQIKRREDLFTIR